MIDILVPSYGRADRIRSVVENIRGTTVHDYRIVVIVEAEEHDKYLLALGPGPDDTIVLINDGPRNYAGAINSAVERCTSEFLFFGSDDLCFHFDWDVEIMNVMARNPNVKVVGTNDLWNEFVLQGWHATHYMVRSIYLFFPGGVVDGGPGSVLYEGYDHNYCDTEFIGTAKARAVFAPCLASVVEHLHFTSGKSPQDATYEKGYAKLAEDRERYFERRHLWWDISL